MTSDISKFLLEKYSYLKKIENEINEFFDYKKDNLSNFIFLLMNHFGIYFYDRRFNLNVQNTKSLLNLIVGKTTHFASKNYINILYNKKENEIPFINLGKEYYCDIYDNVIDYFKNRLINNDLYCQKESLSIGPYGTLFYNFLDKYAKTIAGIYAYNFKRLEDPKKIYIDANKLLYHSVDKHPLYKSHEKIDDSQIEKHKHTLFYPTIKKFMSLDNLQEYILEHKYLSCVMIVPLKIDKIEFLYHLNNSDFTEYFFELWNYTENIVDSTKYDFKPMKFIQIKEIEV